MDFYWQHFLDFELGGCKTSKSIPILTSPYQRFQSKNGSSFADLGSIALTLCSIWSIKFHIAKFVIDSHHQIKLNL